MSEWVRYLSGFRAERRNALNVYTAPGVGPAAVEHTVRLMGLARQLVEHATGLETELPVVYVHPDLPTFRKYSCVAGNAVAFYDGAIHLVDAKDDMSLRRELWLSVSHEYTHHALWSRGIREPFWFQEALAMHVSHERWQDFELAPPGFDVREMVDGFPHTASPKVAERFYGQAYPMLEFLMGFCRSESGCGYPSLVHELEEGAPPATFFQDSIARLAPRSTVPPLDLWQMYFSGLRRAQ